MRQRSSYPKPFKAQVVQEWAAIPDCAETIKVAAAK